MRTRVEYVTAPYHYYNGRASYIPRIVNLPLNEEGEYYENPDDYAVQTITRSVNTITDEKHSMYLASFNGWSGRIWHTGNMLSIKERDTGMSAILFKPYLSYVSKRTLYSGRARLRINSSALISTCIPSVSDFELMERSKPAQESLSIPNFLFELKDFKGMVNLIKKIPDALKHLGRTVRKHQMKYVRNSAKELAEHHLNYEFGILPTLSDLQKLVETCIGMDDEIKRLKAEAGKLLTRRSSCDCEVSWDAKYAWFDNGSLSLTPRYATSVVTPVVKARRRCIARWVYNLPNVNHWYNFELDNELKLRLLGLRNLSLVDVWNAVPWSWLLDWLFNLQATMGRDTIVPVECFDVCFINEIDITFPDFAVYWACPIDSAGANMWQNVGDVNAASPSFQIRSRTYRNPNDPDLTFEAASVNTLSAKQLSLITSILLSRG